MDAFKPRVTKRSVPETKRTVTLYFSDAEGEYLTGEKRDILKKGSVQEEAKELVTELTHGPKGKLIPTLPAETKVLALELDEPGIAKVSFNRALVKGHPGGSLRHQASKGMGEDLHKGKGALLRLPDP